MFKFLKKFKEKILIALACSFIGIGTLLNNTIETKAYTTDTFSHTLTYNKTEGNYLFFSINEGTINFTSSNTGSYVLLINYNSVSTNSTSNTNIQFYNLSNDTYTFIGNYVFGRIYYYSGLNSFLIYPQVTYAMSFNVITLPKFYGTFTIDNIVNIDFVSISEVTTSYYMDTYVGTLQQQYDTLQAEYTSYQNTHAYTNEQYNALMTQNATLTQQVQALQSQYDTYVSLHSYTNTQYETLLNNYNNLQNMYSNLQSNYLVLQQQYESLSLSVAPFTSSKWNNRTGSLNGVTYDLQNEYRDSLVSFEKTYLFITARDLDVFPNYSTGSNTFVLTAYCNQNVVLSGFNVIANLSHLREESFQIDFYLDNNLVYSTIDFDNDMGENDSNSISVDRFLEFNQITVTVIVTYDSLYSNGSYFNALVGTWQDGYDYAVGKLMPEINRLEDELQQSNSQQQVKYNEGYNKGISDANSQPLYGMVIRIL